MKSCGSCGTWQKCSGSDYGLCFALSNQEWFLLCKKVPNCFSITKRTTEKKEGAGCPFFTKKGKK